MKNYHLVGTDMYVTNTTEAQAQEWARKNNVSKVKEIKENVVIPTMFINCLFSGYSELIPKKKSWWKKLFTVVLILVAVNGMATEYIIVRNGNETIVHTLSVGASGSNYVSTYPLSNPTVNTLADIGLPTYLWGLTKTEDGVYDTRLEECKANLVAANAQLSDDTEYINELEQKVRLFQVLFALTGIVFCITLFIGIKNKR